MTSEGLGEMFEGDSAYTCGGKFPLMLMGAERRVSRAQTRERGPHRRERNYSICFWFFWISTIARWNNLIRWAIEEDMHAVVCLYMVQSFVVLLFSFTQVLPLKFLSTFRLVLDTSLWSTLGRGPMGWWWRPWIHRQWKRWQSRKYRLLNIRHIAR